MNKFYDCVFCAVTYRNTEDIKGLLKSLRSAFTGGTYKVIIVDNFYSEEVTEEISAIAKKWDCDFIPSQNSGYGAGNNRGIEFAYKNYSFKYFAVINPDIEVKEFDFSLIADKSFAVAPEIITSGGKWQNPMYVKRNKLGGKLIYKGLKKGSKLLFYLGIALGKPSRVFHRMAFRLSKKPFHKIYEAHGSFVLLPYTAINRIKGGIYDENMFLFSEEDVLAAKLKLLGVDTYYTPKISALHKQDGSMQFRSDLNEQLAKSYIYAYENYIGGKVK